MHQRDIKVIEMGNLHFMVWRLWLVHASESSVCGNRVNFPPPFPFLFRLYPVVIGNGRNLQSDAVISGFHVPKGVSWAFNLFITQIQ